MERKHRELEGMLLDGVWRMTPHLELSFPLTDVPNLMELERTTK